MDPDDVGNDDDVQRMVLEEQVWVAVVGEFTLSMTRTFRTATRIDILWHLLAQSSPESSLG